MLSKRLSTHRPNPKTLLAKEKKDFAGEKKKDLCVRKVAVLFLQRRKKGSRKEKKVLASPATTLMRKAYHAKACYSTAEGCYCARRGGDYGDRKSSGKNCHLNIIRSEGVAILHKSLAWFLVDKYQFV